VTTWFECPTAVTTWLGCVTTWFECAPGWVTAWLATAVPECVRLAWSDGWVNECVWVVEPIEAPPAWAPVWPTRYSPPATWLHVP
jgi:hypothetical protein